MPKPEPSRTEVVRSINGRAESGVGMDRRVEKHRRPWRWILLATVTLVALAAIIQLAGSLGGERTLRVDSAQLTIATTTLGVYEDYVPIRAEVEPRDTVFLDAVEGGRVERVLVEDGSTVRAGQQLIVLSNTTLQLDVIGREAAVTEQLNALRSLELQLEQNRQRHRRELADINFEVERTQREVGRRQRLFDEEILARTDLEDAEADLRYQQERLATELEARDRDEDLQAAQLMHLRRAAEQLAANLDLARRNLENLTVRAPRDGRLSGFELEVGQSVDRGSRMGQVDSPDAFKLTADVDEFYLGRVKPGLVATLTVDAEVHEVTVTRIRPQVSGGQFGIDMDFSGDAPAGIRRGQTIPARLTLGGRSDALLIPNGAFAGETGGHWVFVVDGSTAIRREITTGRRNASQIEVLDGLAAGEKVVTSSYSAFQNIDRLTLD